MNVVESKRTRHLVIHVERGEELPTALIRALDEVEAKAGIITGTGIVEAVEVVGIDARGQGHPRRINAPALVSFSGNVAVGQGTTNMQLFGTLSREAALGQETFAGQITWARAQAIDLFVTVFDDVSLARETDEHGFTSALNATSRASGTAPRVTVQEPAREATREVQREAAPAAVVTPLITPPPQQQPKPVAKEPESEPRVQHQQAQQGSGPALSPPARLHKPHEDTTEVYPEIGDLVTHFHFGECEVISSDGERIRLRQIKDGRVREVSLAMLRIEGPTLDAAEKRTFKLHRKN
jgi:predicted DNA-binding protein with PD1-like motif